MKLNLLGLEQKPKTKKNAGFLSVIHYDLQCTKSSKIKTISSPCNIEEMISLADLIKQFGFSPSHSSEVVCSFSKVMKV